MKGPYGRIFQVEGNLPPSVATMPADMRDELLAFQALPVGELRRIATGQVPAAQQARHLELLDNNSQDLISSAEQAELAALGRSADRQMLRKAYAWAVLHWLGHPFPPLNELPLESMWPRYRRACCILQSPLPPVA